MSRRHRLREFATTLVVVTLLTVVLTVLFSSPDEPPSTIRQWSRQNPVAFLRTAVTELGGTSETAEYGPPYNSRSSGPHVAFLYPQRWLGVSHPIDTAKDFVIGPLRTVPDAVLQAEISRFEQVNRPLKVDGIESFEKAVTANAVSADGSVKPGEYENVDHMMKALLALAQSGGLDRYLVSDRRSVYADYTKPLLFMADGGVLQKRALAEHLLGDQWAMMNETGSYPGQPWLWLYTFWYRIAPFKSSANADILVFLVMAVLTLGFVCLPLIPGLRAIPRLIPIHRLIWRGRYPDTGKPGVRRSRSEASRPRTDDTELGGTG